MRHALTPHLCYWQATCTVYGVRSAGAYLLIDCGTHLRFRSVEGVQVEPEEMKIIVHSVNTVLQNHSQRGPNTLRSIAW